MARLSVSNSVIYDLAAENPNMSDLDRLTNLYWALCSVVRSGTPGDVVELGCNAGRTSVLLEMVLEAEGADRTLHLYDSFDGLPAPSEADRYLKQGDCRATEADVLATFERWNLRPPRVHAGWFEETLPRHLPDRVAFAYLDGDFYESIRTGLAHVWPRLSAGGSLLVDDYCDRELSPRAWDGLPGVKKACDDFFADVPASRRVLVGVGDLAFAEFRKPSD
ncbi:class I SAM-dependent methyltransferase [Streptomyces sp. AV19]|uniref:TylF/MycF/NovP-related O-methyltransferase n=1 Tax=Streptomyces sp. AV19 TaxID=2793068 RepID=UPI0018FE822D|nr:TylF/MycF/NovP-related O-methyltransferase [Streptomyces sp. AV19]MBH1937470.1 class I SAM-dependent methyltransferase [Streptomyces sp. AV19]MDG4533757.1 TylF/MycF family methyltransferase [Streptomyces sp. AV19]